MSARPSVRFDGEAGFGANEEQPILVPLPPTFTADPPESLSAPTIGGFMDDAKSPHGVIVHAKSPHGITIGAKSPHEVILHAKSPHGITLYAKSPHGISRTGVVPLTHCPPPASHHSGRRPVIAVLDTEIGRHPWLDSVTVDGEPESFWSTAEFTPSITPSALPTGYSESGPAERAYGHGTFVAGIIRQLAPDARILSLPLMSDAGHAATPSVLEALTWLVDRVTNAQAGDPDQFVDVVNLSFGWYRGRDDKDFPAAEYRRLLDALGNAGVQVVASAGNRSTSEPVYPAAFAREQTEDPNGPQTPLVSVGALDPDGNLAVYSNTGTWVRLLAPGTGLISTIPPASGHSWTASYDDAGCPLPNPNHLARGYARWGGTSFAAAWVSAKFAAHLLSGPAGSQLDDLHPEAVHARAEAALEGVRADIDEWRRLSSA